MPLDSRATADCPASVPVPDTWPGRWQGWRTMRRNLLELLPEEVYLEPIVTGGRLRRWHMVMEPSLLEHVLKRREDIYPRSDVTLRIFRSTRGDNVMSSYGPAWRRQHAAMVPVFQQRGIAAVAPLMTEAADAWSRDWAARPPGRHDVGAAMTDISCRIICDVALSGREQLDRAGLADLVARYIASVSRVSLLDLIGLPRWVPRPGRLRDRAGPEMDATVDAVCAARARRGAGSPPDVLDMLMAAGDDGSGAGLSPLEIRNNLLVFLIAGHETTALTLSWAAYLLAFDPGVQARARAEARAVLGGRPASFADVPRLTYIRQVLDEAMRLYPAGALLSRTARGADDLGGRPVRPGDTIILPIYALHRHRALWEAPDRFDPDRFAPGLAKSRHRFSHIPFSAGPRGCIGMAFAITEMVIVLATLLARVELRLPPGFDPKPELILTLRPANGIHLDAGPG
jgi:cytochrome P450